MLYPIPFRIDFPIFTTFFLSKKKSLSTLRCLFSSYLQEHMQAIKVLPDTDSPELFGLPENIERSAQCTASRRMIDQLKRLLRPIEIADKFDVQKWNAELSPILVLWKKLNQASFYFPYYMYIYYLLSISYDYLM